MDPLTQQIVDVLAKYAIDKGVSLAKEAGQAAVDVAARLFRRVLDRLKQDPAEARNARRFENNPAGYAAPIADAVDEALKADPPFAAELKALLSDYRQAAISNIAHTSTGDVFVGDHNVKIGDNKGTIVIGGSGHSVSNVRSGGTDIEASAVDVGGDVMGRDKATSS
ncbi:MAG: hypothetical protein HGB05_15045 [Chloroflexi bacterium]|nr:hypothetical protein [Chloroflexota bacterium]